MVSKFKSHSPSVALDKHVLLGLEVIQSTCACARMIFASFTPLKSMHHLLHASTDLSSLLLLMCVPPGTTRGAGWGCALCFPSMGTGYPHLRGLFKGRYTRTHAARAIRRYFPDSPRTAGAAFARFWKTHPLHTPFCAKPRLSHFQLHPTRRPSLIGPKSP